LLKPFKDLEAQEIHTQTHTQCLFCFCF